MRKKAQFLELDALFAIAILIGGIFLLKGLYIHPYDAPQLDNTATDAVTTLQAKTMNSLGTAYLGTLQSQLSGTGILINPNETIARQLTMLLVAAEEEGTPPAERQVLLDAAEDLAETAMQGLTRPGEHYNITLLSADRRYTIASNDSNATVATQARTMLSGLQVNKSVFGYLASAYLSDANSRQASYYKFGGFVGQGNITATLDLLADPLEFTVEGDFHDNFTITVNDNDPCVTITIPNNPDPFTEITRADITTECASNLTLGKNLVYINFTGDDIDQHYIGGGYLKVTYLSDKTYATPVEITKNHTLPGINGIFNLYDAIYIPGRLTNMTINLHYFANHTNSNNTVFFTLGDRILHQDNSSLDEQRITINQSDIIAAGIDFDDYENQTVPFRFGYDNGSLELLASSVIDAVLITDLSGSMGWTYDSTYANRESGNVVVDCADEVTLYQNETERLSVAKCANKNFTDLLINDEDQLIEPNRLGLVSYNDYANSRPFTDDQTQLENTINSYSASGGTCICCGIIEAIELFEDDPSHDISTTQHNVTRAILVMTDGIHDSWRWSTCRTYLRAEGYLGASENAPDLNHDGSQEQGDYAVAAACYAHEKYNISIYAVGFGRNTSIDINTLNHTAGCDNYSNFHIADSPDRLTEIYNDIARDIIQIADYNAQIISFDVEVNDSTIYPDSYIEYTYEPHPLPNLHGRLLIDGERQPFTEDDPCTQTNLNFPLALYPLEASILSYSGNYWTDYVEVNQQELYNLTSYGLDYQFLGDPFSIGIPPGIMDRGPNNLSLRTAESPTQAIDCSSHNKLLYTATLENTFTLNQAYPEAEGCNWTVDMLGTTTNILIPETYTGPNECSYQTGTITYDDDDAWQALGEELFRSFDVNLDGSVDIDFAQNNLDLNLQQQENIPYLWGPALLEVTVWR